MGDPAFLIPLIVALAISMAIVVPLTGVLVRYRANYNPKSLQLDAEGGAVAHTGPVVRSYFQMMGRVYRLEGWAGLYKGLMPTLISSITVSFVIIFLDDAESSRHGKYRAPDTGILGTFFYSIALLVISLPTAILTYRSITTPYKLPYLKPLTALRVLLTPTERRRPWILYLTPGLMAAELAHIAIVILFLGPIRRLLLPGILQPNPSDISIVKLVVYIVIICLSVVALSPLEIIATRLAIQRNHSSSELNSTAQEVDGDAEEAPEYSSEEEVIGLRQESDPYLGLADCIKRIVDEEGWTTLYRAWWLTFLGGFGSAFY